MTKKTKAAKMQQINDMLRTGVIKLDKNGLIPSFEAIMTSNDTYLTKEEQTRSEGEFEALRAAFDKDPGKTMKNILSDSEDFPTMNHKLAIIGISPSVYGYLREENRLLSVGVVSVNADNIVKRWSQYNSPLWRTLNGEL